MPAKAAWCGRVEEIILQIEKSFPIFVTAEELSSLLHVSRRRAQQIIAPCVEFHIGKAGIPSPPAVIQRLKALAGEEQGNIEADRRRKLGESLSKMQQERIERPRLLVEAPTAIVNQEFRNMPEGVTLAPGSITIEFDQPKQALEKLLALAMAIGNEFEKFEDKVSRPRV